MKADTYVAACVAGVPKKWWEDMQGEWIHELVQELVGDVEVSKGVFMSIQGRIGLMFLEGTKPTPMQALALLLYLSAPVRADEEEDMVTRDFIQALREWGWSDLVWWYDNVKQEPEKAYRKADSTEWFDGA